ncbi:hypothetical protein AL035_15050 [Salipiger aestuarii]|nr:hypothetical protein AL035_15050 [Salipiger aestuarii]
MSGERGTPGFTFFAQQKSVGSDSVLDRVQVGERLNVCGVRAQFIQHRLDGAGMGFGAFQPLTPAAQHIVFEIVNDSDEPARGQKLALHPPCGDAGTTIRILIAPPTIGGVAAL